MPTVEKVNPALQAEIEAEKERFAMLREIRQKIRIRVRRKPGRKIRRIR